VATIGGRIVSSYRANVGIRSIRVDNKGIMRLNGRRFRLRGASVHEDNPTHGAAMTSGQRALNFKLLRQLGANITRAHYPLHPDFYERADRAGVLIWNQIPVYKVSTDVLGSSAFRRKALRYLESTIRRDQNHPSVFAWSIANELSANVRIGQRKYIQEAAALIRSEDPTRLVALDVAGNPSAEPVDTFSSLDAIGANAYYGWYRGPTGQTADRGLLGPYLEQMHDFYPTQALFMTEFGAEANRSGLASEKGTFAFQQDLLSYQIQRVDRLSFVNGAILWLLRDFKVTPDWEGGNPRPAPPVNYKGVVDQYGRKKPAFDTVARLYRRR
jgi:beta-glucuronidase